MARARRQEQQTGSSVAAADLVVAPVELFDLTAPAWQSVGRAEAWLRAQGLAGQIVDRTFAVTAEEMAAARRWQAVWWWASHRGLTRDQVGDLGLPPWPEWFKSPAMRRAFFRVH